MSNEKNTGAKATAGGSAALAKPQPPAGFAHVSQDLPSYSAESCNGLPAHGTLVDHVDMPDAKDDDGRPKKWTSLVLIALSPTMGQTIDGEVVEIKTGDRFMIGMGKALEDLGKLAENRDYLFEVWLMPGTKRKVAGSAKTFVPWDIHINPKPTKRPATAFSLRSYTSASPAALPERSANGATSEADLPI